MPGVQNPHCSPCSSLKPSCSGCSSLARGQALDGADLVPVDLDGQHRAGLHRPAVDQHRARAAVGRVAARMRAGQPEPAADQVSQQQPRLHLGDLLLAVDRELDPAYRDSPWVSSSCPRKRSSWSGCPFLLRRTLRAAQDAHHEGAHHVPLVFGAAAMIGPWPRGLRRQFGGLRDAVGGQRPPGQRAAAASVAAMVDPPTPVRAMPALVTFSPTVSIRHRDPDGGEVADPALQLEVAAGPGPSPPGSRPPRRSRPGPGRSGTAR